MRHIWIGSIYSLCSTAWAQPVKPQHPATRQVEERVSDGFGLGLTTVGLSVGGGALGYALGSDADAGFFLSTEATYLLFGGMLGLTLGPYLFDRWTDGDGSLLGAYLGLLASGMIAGRLPELVRSSQANITAGLFVAAGLGVGYGAFDPLDVAPAVVPMATEEGVRPGLGLTGRF